MQATSMAIITALLLSLVVPGAVYAQQASNEATQDVARPLPDTFDPKRNALNDLQTALALAGQQHKRVLVDLGGSWCKACLELDQFFEQNPDLKQQRDAAFIWLKVNVSEENKNDELVKKLPWFIGYPHWFVLDENGKVLHTSFAQDTREDLQAFLTKWGGNQTSPERENAGSAQ